MASVSLEEAWRNRILLSLGEDSRPGPAQCGPGGAGLAGSGKDCMVQQLPFLALRGLLACDQDVPCLLFWDYGFSEALPAALGLHLDLTSAFTLTLTWLLG